MCVYILNIHSYIEQITQSADVFHGSTLAWCVCSSFRVHPAAMVVTAFSQHAKWTMAWQGGKKPAWWLDL